MAKNKFIVYIILGFVVVALAAFWWWSKDNSLNNNSVDKWTDINYVFDIEIPQDFDKYQVERLNGKIEEAKIAYQEKPDDNWTWVMLGNIYEFVGDYDRALEVYYKALSITPDDITSILNIATISEEQFNDYGEAEKYYSKAIAVFPQMPDLYNRLAMLYWHKIGNLENAEKTYLQSVDQSKGHPDALLAIIDFYRRTGQEDKARPYAQQLLDNYPDNDLYQEEFGYLTE